MQKKQKKQKKIGTGNCAKDKNLPMQTNCICTDQILSERIRCHKIPLNWTCDN